MPRKRRTPITDKKATVHLERNGLSIRIDDINAAEAPLVAYDLLQAVRLLQRMHAELVPELGTVGGYHALDTSDDPWADEGRRRAGFRTSP